MKKSLPVIFSIVMSISPAFANETISFQLNNETKLYVVKCEAGEFNMSSPEDEVGRQKGEYDLYKVSIDKEFFIGKYEITQAQYIALMGENPSKNVGNEKPVERVTYYNAIEFCNKLNKITESTRPAGYEFTLPSEIQWEYACRAGTNTAFNNGKHLSSPKGAAEEIDEIAWYKHNSETKTHAVGMKKSNNWGIYDMHGNVAEWCLDAFDDKGLVSKVNNDSKCAIRGGAYFFEPEKLRSASRGANPPNTQSSGVGFRIALVNNSIQSEKVEISAKKNESFKTDNSAKNSESAKTQSVINAGVKISVSVNGVKFPLIGCPAGEFTIGSPEKETGRDANENQRKISIQKGFYIGKYEITQGQYKAIMGNNPSITTGDKLPVHNINWLDAQKFCQKLNELTTDKRPANTIFALPTEEQWEYACRSGYSTSLNNGKNLTKSDSSDTELNKLGWYNANACGVVQTVGKKTANAWGVHDMLGNVWEWCSNAVESTANEEFKTRILRGGGFKSKAAFCRCAKRYEAKENLTSEDFGFRVILKMRE
ncbi:MAG: SUMF1/EgtB/PvdO family nonheme iron enzyme [Candidatus Riflebacteria bacterium]|nr:SUMF1/EgtB/PvdO family nonheme iron enzyme [Candidatus Riflebacteria bacterium]